jgi:bacteriocin biosynthesis cyclodehydratase domain-containing protein
MPLRRPTLLPGLARAWRGPHTLQLGADPPRAISIDLPDPRVARILDLLDGRRTERAALARIAADGSSADDARVLLDALHTAGLVLPAADLLPPALPDAARQRLIGEATALALDDRPDRPPPVQILRRRAASRVLITGSGRLAAPLAVALAEAGIGQVHADLAGAVLPSELPGGPLRAGDIGRPRAEAIATAVRRAAPHAGTRTVRRGAASLVLQLGYGEPAALLAAAHAQRRQAHLLVAIRDGSVVVGPLVRPGGGPCLNCLELHRRDRDPGRPGPAGSPATVAEPCAVATVLAATGYAVAEALAFLDGGCPATLGASVEIAAPGRSRRRTWAPHPDCRCARRPRRRTGGPERPERLKAEPSVTMIW